MLIYGKQVFLYILEKYPDLIEEIILSKEIDKTLFSKISRLNKKIIKVDNQKAQALAKGKNHQGFFLRVKDYELVPFESMKNFNFLVVLVGVTDVGNIGAVIRSAYALGVDGIVISDVKSLNFEGVARTSSGALLDMPICLMPNTLDLMNELKQVDFTLFGATMSGVDVRDVTFNYSKKALFLGSEESGLNKKVLNKIDKKISIVMSRDFDSLNVSTAAAILIDRMR